MLGSGFGALVGVEEGMEVGVHEYEGKELGSVVGLEVGAKS
jgi:hypothetical protein